MARFILATKAPIYGLFAGLSLFLAILSVLEIFSASFFHAKFEPSRREL